MFGDTMPACNKASDILLVLKHFDFYLSVLFAPYRIPYNTLLKKPEVYFVFFLKKLHECHG